MVTALPKAISASSPLIASPWNPKFFINLPTRLTRKGHVSFSNVWSELDRHNRASKRQHPSPAGLSFGSGVELASTGQSGGRLRLSRKPLVRRYYTIIELEGSNSRQVAKCAEKSVLRSGM